MSWGTYYQYNGYLSHIGKHEIETKREDCNYFNDKMWREILAYMAATPPAYAKDDEGNEYPWAEFIAMRLHELRDEIEVNDKLIARLEDCEDTMRENPENVTEG